MNAQSPAARTPPRSAFVSALGWSFLLLGILFAMINLVQWSWVTLLQSPQDMQAAVRDMRAARMFPEPILFLFEHIRLWLAAMSALSIVTAIAAWGLLCRREWARLAFIIMLWLGVAANLAGVALPFMASEPSEWRASMSALLPAEARAEAEAMFTMFTYAASVIALLFAAGFAWTAWRLMAPAIRDEFSGAP